jgi:hypothetical protein
MKKINKIILELYNDRKQLLFLSFLGYICLQMESLMPSDPNVNQCSGIFTGIAVVVGAGITYFGTKEQGKKNRDQAQGITDAQAEQARIERDLLETQKDAYRAMEFKNPYENYENVYKDLQNQYTNLENTYEDLTVNTQQSEFEKQMSQQSQANIMTQMRGAAGGSGVAGLAQAMANQGALQAQKASASIGLQEEANKKLMAQEASRLQTIEAQGETNAMMARLGGQDAQQRAVMQGEAMLAEQEASRQATLLGMAYGSAAGANSGLQAAQLNQSQVDIASSTATTQALGQFGSSFVTAAGGIDKKKKDHNYSGVDPTGL